jgi:hypothetical protein
VCRWYDYSLIQSRKFLEVDPVSQTPIEHLGYHYVRARRFAGAIAQYSEEVRRVERAQPIT